MKNESGTVESQDTTLNFDFIVSFAQMGSNSMFTILACTLYTHYRRSTLFLGQQAFKIDQSLCIQCNFHCIFVEWPYQSSLLYQSLHTVLQISLEGDCDTSLYHDTKPFICKHCGTYVLYHIQHSTVCS